MHRPVQVALLILKAVSHLVLYHNLYYRHAALLSLHGVPKMGVAPEILANTLEHYGHGRAMWCPEPPEDLDNRAHEIQVGDVGYLDEDGGFRRLFNVTVGPDDELNKGGVPDGFEPLRFNKRLLSLRRDQFPPSAFCSRTVKTKEVEGHAQA